MYLLVWGPCGIERDIYCCCMELKEGESKKLIFDVLSLLLSLKKNRRIQITMGHHHGSWFSTIGTRNGYESGTIA
jgi:hypothetical protein